MMLMTGVEARFLRLRLWVVAVLLAVLGLAMVAEFTSDVSDDTVRVRLFEMEEQDSDNNDSLQASLLLHALPAALWMLLPVGLFVRPTGIPLIVCTALVHSPRLRGPPSRF